MKVTLNTLRSVHDAIHTSLESLSAKKASPVTKKPKKGEEANTLDTLIPVQLPAKDMAEFVMAFHPTRPFKAPHAFLEETRYMVEISAYVNSIYEGLRFGMSRASVAQSATAVGDQITKEIEINYKNSSELEKKAKEYLMSMSTGRNHIIRDSERYKGGKDILYVGLRGANVSPLLTSGHTMNHQLPLVTSSYAYNDKKEAFESKLGKALVDTGLALQKILIGEQCHSLSSSYSRAYSMHSIDPKSTLIAEITKVFMSGPLAKLGIPVALPTFNGVQTQHAMNRMPKFTQILVMREPNHTIVQLKARQREAADETLGICTEALALQPDFRFSYAVNLPKNFCEYITQTKDEQIPLVPLNTWATVWSSAMLRPPKMRAAKEGEKLNKAQGDYVLVPERAPKYVLRPSASEELIARRKALGLFSEKGRVNEDGLFIDYGGNLNFLTTSDESNVANAKEYEKNLEEALAISYNAGTPLAAGQRGSTGLVFDLASAHYAEKIAAIKDHLQQYQGSVQAINWDLNLMLSVRENDPDKLEATKMVGANRPDELNLATYLRQPFNRGMRDMFSQSRVKSETGRGQINRGSFSDAAEGITSSSIFSNFARLYNHFLDLKKVPELKALVDKAATNLNIKDLGDEHTLDFELQPLDPQKTIYKQIIQRDLSVMDPAGKTGQIIVALLGVVAKQAAAQQGSNLARVCIRDNIEFKEHDRFFDGVLSPVGDFARLYTWLGGEVFHLAISAILAIPHKDFLSMEGAKPSTEEHEGHPGFLSIVKEVMPMCVMLGKYAIPETRDKLYEKADEMIEANNETKFGEDDLNLAGSRPKGPNGKGGMKLFPHQGEALSRLKSHPKIAILDIAPGGGKTTIGIADIAMCYADGLIKKPFVFAPNRLVRNWIEDCHKSFAGWNVIPVTTETYALWGEERLTEMILKAPPNTIVIVGNSFISHTKQAQLVVGNAVDNISNSIEFCKKFEPDYVIIDESHRIRNPYSALHKGIKTIMQMTSVKYGRIATGTLIQNVLSDVVGQSSIFNGQIFRTLKEFEAENKGVVETVNGKDIIDYKDDTPLKARRRLSEFATVISFKRKEWAFMLPSPVETFIRVNMEERRDADGKLVPDDVGHKLRLFYDAVLNKTLDEAKNDPKLRKKKKKEEDDEDDEETGEDKDAERTVTTADGVAIDVSDTDDDSDFNDEMEAALQPYLQRIERILTDPFGDPDLLPVAKEIFGTDFDENYATPKVERVIERIKMHFKETPWVKGNEYSACDISDYNGKSYIFKSELAKGEGKARSDHAPDSDTENWKPQIRGKVFVTCRYTRSVDAIFRAMPKDLQAKTVKFHGEISGKDGTKDGNIQRFMTDPKIQIMIANEMGISEGHNFQMASRFIRVEAPWAPGELDQTASRIFRPDVGGEYTRQIIFLDWIICDGTLEVAKMGRLVSKMLKRTKFDELDNPKYYKNLNPMNLPIIKMSLDNIRKLHSMEDLCKVAGDGDLDDIHPHSYLGQYNFLVNEQGAEFREMRKTKRAYMIDVAPTPMPASAKEIEYVPWVVNHPTVEDKKGDGLVKLTDALEDEDSEIGRAAKVNRKALIGQFVRCEFGLGTIVRVTSKNGTSSDEDGDEDGDGRDVSKVGILLSQGGGVEMLSPSKVYLATKVTERTKNRDNAKAPKPTAADKARAEKARAHAEAQLKKIRDAEKKAKLKAKLQPKAKSKAAPEPEPEEDEGGDSIYLYPIVYNDFLALEGLDATGENPDVLKHYGFEYYNHMAIMPIKNYKAFTSVLDYLEAKYTLMPKVVKILDTLHDSFASGRGRKFQVELAPYSEFPVFHKTQKQVTQVLNKRKPELHIYPLLLNGVLYLACDLARNPSFKKSVGPTIAGAGKFVVNDGMYIHFFRNKTAMGDMLRQLDNDGVAIANRDELKSEFKALSLKAALTNKE